MIPMMISNMAAGIVAIKTDFKGPSFSPVSGTKQLEKHS